MPKIITFLLLAFSLGVTHLSLALDQTDYAWIGERIFQNETGGKRENLTFWSDAEAFPSFGLGHFIWLPKHVNEPFEATFYEMVQFVSSTHPAPEWVKQPFAPWANKVEFNQAWLSQDMANLHDWLAQTKPQQTEFIVQRFERRLTQLKTLLSAQQPGLVVYLEHLQMSRQGQFALIDYVNFKGWGDIALERYQGQGWGLLQVLQAMPDGLTAAEVLPAFVEAAQQVLLKRTELAPSERQESRWLPGWNRRLQRYLKE